MQFLKYIERQKRLIRDRHVGETFLITPCEVVKVAERFDKKDFYSKSKERVS